MTADTLDHNVGPPFETLRFDIKVIRFVPGCVAVPRVIKPGKRSGKDQSHTYTQYQAYTSQGIQLLETTCSSLKSPLTAVQCSSDNMPSPLSRFKPDASSHSSLALPAILFLTSLVANICTPTKNSLLTSAIAWLAVCASNTSKGSARSLLEATTARKIAWAAGLLFALAQVCHKAADGRAIWWAKVISHLGGFWE